MTMWYEGSQELSNEHGVLRAPSILYFVPVSLCSVMTLLFLPSSFIQYTFHFFYRRAAWIYRINMEGSQKLCTQYFMLKKKCMQSTSKKFGCCH